MVQPTGQIFNGKTDHTDVANPMVTFCKVDLDSATGCLQGATWEIKLYLHDNKGHTRTISVTVQTDDARADESDPIAYAEIDMRPEYEDQIEDEGLKEVGDEEWPQRESF